MRGKHEKTLLPSVRSAAKKRETSEWGKGRKYNEISLNSFFFPLANFFSFSRRLGSDFRFFVHWAGMLLLRSFARPHFNANWSNRKTENKTKNNGQLSALATNLFSYNKGKKSFSSIWIQLAMLFIAKWKNNIVRIDLTETIWWSSLVG